MSNTTIINTFNSDNSNITKIETNFMTSTEKRILGFKPVLRI